MLKNIITSFVLLILLSTSLFAQTKKTIVSGSVMTTDGKPAEFISVSIKGTTYGTTSDADGKFSFEAPPGDHTLIVFSITAHKVELPITITKNSECKVPAITIVENSQQLQEVVVTGQFAPQSLRKSVYKVNVISAKKIEEKASTNIQSLLNTELGIRMSNDMALGETKFELMEMSGNNVKVLIDGIPMLDRDANKQSLSQIDINTIERIEIVEGPMSVTYGSDALAGVINIITKKPDAATDKNIYNISAKIQEESAGKEYDFFTNKGIHYESLNGSWTHKSGFNVAAGFTRNASGGWTGDKTGREKQWQPKDQYMTNAILGYKKKDLNIWYRMDYLDETIYTPLNQDSPNEIKDRDFLSDRITNQLQADWKLNNNLTLNAAASYQDLTRKTKTVITDTQTGEKWLSLEESAQDVSTNQSGFFRTTAAWTLSSKLSFQPGIEYQWDEASGNRIHGNPDITDFAFFLSAEYNPFEWMSLRPGIRSTFNSVYDAPPLIPALNTKFSLNQHMDLRLSYAYGFRAPALRELYLSMHNPNHNIDGNPDLKAEYSNNFTGSYTWRILHDSDIRLTSTLSGFYNDFRNRIAIIPDVNDPNHNTYGNIEKYKTTGGTFENALVWKDLQANLSFSYIGRYNAYVEDKKYDDQDLEQFRFSPEITASVSYLWGKPGLNINLFYKYTGARKEYALNSDKELTLLGYDSFNWADFTLSKKIGKYFRLEGGIKNLFDVTTITNTSGGGHGSSGTAAFIGCGRSYFLGFNYTINN